MHLISKRFSTGFEKSMEIYSFIIGKFSDLELPHPFLAPVLKLYGKCYKVNVNELSKPYMEYSSLSDFFTRPLKEGLRIIDSRPETVVSPVDGHIIETGKMDSPVPNTYKIKNRFYTLEELLGKMTFYDFSNEDMKGLYMLFHLPPGCYHRIHSPITGNISSLSFTPGTLYPVNRLGRRFVPEYHIKNSKVLLQISTGDDRMHIFMALVGALAVGNITLTYNGQREFSPRHKEHFETISPPHSIKKGEELGIFKLGSSVLMICYCHKDADMNFSAGEGKINMGNAVIESGVLKTGQE